MPALANLDASALVRETGAVLDNLFTSDDERAKARLALAELEQRPLMAELDRQIAEAKHASVYVAGARPAILWVGAAGLAYAFIAQPLLAWVTALLFSLLSWGGGLAGADPIPLEAMLAAMPPALDPAVLLACLSGSGGMAALRSFEKTKGVARASLYEDARPPAAPATMADLERYRAAQLALGCAPSRPAPVAPTMRAPLEPLAPTTGADPFETGAEGRV